MLSKCMAIARFKTKWYYPRHNLPQKKKSVSRDGWAKKKTNKRERESFDFL